MSAEATRSTGGHWEAPWSLRGASTGHQSHRTHPGGTQRCLQRPPEPQKATRRHPKEDRSSSNKIVMVKNCSILSLHRCFPLSQSLAQGASRGHQSHKMSPRPGAAGCFQRPQETTRSHPEPLEATRKHPRPPGCLQRPQEALQEAPGGHREAHRRPPRSPRISRNHRRPPGACQEAHRRPTRGIRMPLGGHPDNIDQILNTFRSKSDKYLINPLSLSPTLAPAPSLPSSGCVQRPPQPQETTRMHPRPPGCLQRSRKPQQDTRKHPREDRSILCNSDKSLTKI